MVFKKIGRYTFNTLQLVLCTFGLVSTFYMIIDLTYFLSVPKFVKSELSSRGNNWNYIIKFSGYYFLETWVVTSWALLSNMFLLSLFILQHSLLASKYVKDAFNTCGLQPIYRTLYVITTSGILWVRLWYELFWQMLYLNFSIL